jgi:hypothetical protein
MTTQRTRVGEGPRGGEVSLPRSDRVVFSHDIRYQHEVRREQTPLLSYHQRTGRTAGQGRRTASAGHVYPAQHAPPHQHRPPYSRLRVSRQSGLDLGHGIHRPGSHGTAHGKCSSSRQHKGEEESNGQRGPASHVRHGPHDAQRHNPARRPCSCIPRCCGRIMASLSIQRPWPNSSHARLAHCVTSPGSSTPVESP